MSTCLEELASIEANLYVASDRRPGGAARIISKIRHTVGLWLPWAASVLGAVLLLTLITCVGCVMAAVLVCALATVDACQYAADTTISFILRQGMKTPFGLPRVFLILWRSLPRFTN